MDRQTIELNILNNYGKYGVTKEIVNNLIDSGLESGLNYDAIYLGLEMNLSTAYGQPFYCSSHDVARAFEVSEDEINKVIEESREELIASGEDPDEYFRITNSTKFTM